MLHFQRPSSECGVHMRRYSYALCLLSAGRYAGNWWAFVTVPCQLAVGTRSNVLCLLSVLAWEAALIGIHKFRNTPYVVC